MKQLLTFALLLSTNALFAQTQPAPTKPQKISVVTMYEDDVKALIHFLEAYKATVIYQPGQTDRSAVQTQKDLDAYLGYIMQSAILKRDSVPAPTPATK